MGEEEDFDKKLKKAIDDAILDNPITEISPGLYRFDACDGNIMIGGEGMINSLNQALLEVLKNRLNDPKFYF